MNWTFLRISAGPEEVYVVIAEIGHFALVLALFMAVLQVVLPAAGIYTGDDRLMSLGRSVAVLQFALIAAAFAAVTNAFVTSDFSLAVVAQNSHSLKPMLYKVAGVWGNHEGSMLLWVLILALCGAAIAGFGANLPDTFRSRVLSVQGAIGAAFLLFILLTSNPFTRIVPPPLDGNDLNPLSRSPGRAGQLSGHPTVYREVRRCLPFADGSGMGIRRTGTRRDPVLLGQRYGWRLRLVRGQLG